MTKTWFITGASRGIGAAIVKAALNAGDNVVATARNPQKIHDAYVKSEQLLSLELDVTQDSHIVSAVDTAINRYNRVDVLVNNAGYGHAGVFEETSLEAIRAQYDTNVFGLMAVTKLIIPLMRRQRSGRIINVSSIAGWKGVFGGSVYHSSKFAIEGFSQALAEELISFGIYVTAVSPGFFRTDFLDSSSIKYAKRSIHDYDSNMAVFEEFYKNHRHAQIGDPAKLAAIILQLSQTENPPVSFLAGSDAVEWASAIAKQKQVEIEKWRELSTSTDGKW